MSVLSGFSGAQGVFPDHPRCRERPGGCHQGAGAPLTRPVRGMKCPSKCFRHEPAYRMRMKLPGQVQAARIASLEEQLEDMGISGFHGERSIDRDFGAISLQCVSLFIHVTRLLTPAALLDCPAGMFAGRVQILAAVSSLPSTGRSLQGQQSSVPQHSTPRLLAPARPATTGTVCAP